MGLLTGTRCALHPQDAAQQACHACGRLSCSQCLSGGLCPRCAVPGGEAPPSKRAGHARTLAFGALAATLLGLLAVVSVLPRALSLLWPAGLITGVVAFVMSLAELGAIARGERPASGRTLALTARRTGIAHILVVWLFFSGVFAWGFVQGFTRQREKLRDETSRTVAPP